jgi:nucleoside-diphosphate-sugar epimerase
VRVLVTGASGFVGTAAVTALRAAGADVVATSRRRPEVDGPVDWRPVDLLDTAATQQLVLDVRPDTVLHLAWTVEHGMFWTTSDNLNWVAASLQLARAAADHGVRRFIGTGTCYEYAWPPNAPCNEHATPVVPSLLYGISKDATRRVVEAFCQTRGIDFAWARLFFLYGQGEGAGRLVPSISRSLAARQPARCSSGRAIRDFMDVRDVGAALAALALSNVTGPINVASGQAVAVSKVAQLLGTIAGRPDLIHLGSLPDRADEPPVIVADVDRLFNEVGFKPIRSLDEGLKDAFENARLLIESEVSR